MRLTTDHPLDYRPFFNLLERLAGAPEIKFVLPGRLIAIAELGHHLRQRIAPLEQAIGADQPPLRRQRGQLFAHLLRRDTLSQRLPLLLQRAVGGLRAQLMLLQFVGQHPQPVAVGALPFGLARPVGQRI